MSQEKTIMKSALLFAGLLATSAFAGGNALTGVSVAPSRGGVEVTVKCEQPPVFNVFRLKDPDRLVVDVSGATVDAIKGHHEGAGPVTGVVASQFPTRRPRWVVSCSAWPTRVATTSRPSRTRW